MKVSKRLIDILKNFSTVNTSILFTEGNVVSTMAVARNIVAKATVEEHFPQEFAIYNLNEFLSAISLFNDPELDFHEKYVLIKESGSKKNAIRYFYTNKSLVVYPTKQVSMPSVDAEFTLSSTALSQLVKASSILGARDMAIVGGEEGISIVVRDNKNPSSNDFEVAVSEAKSPEFKHFLKMDNIKLMNGDYQVKVSEKGLVLFTSADGLVEYAVAMERG